MIQLLAKLLSALHSDAHPAQISGGLVLGLALALVPLANLSGMFLLVLVCALSINLSAVMVAYGFISIVALVFNPLLEGLGAYLLHLPQLQEYWQLMYQSDWWRLSHFNHSLTLGAVVFVLAFSLPLFFLFKFIIVEYRVHILAWANKFKLVKMLKASKFYDYYQRFYAGK
jgi:uncharacterized protein (TIGR03546 family)